MKVRRPHTSSISFTLQCSIEDSYVSCTLLHKLSPEYGVTSPIAERTMNTTSRNVTNHNNMTGLNATNATNPDGSDCITNATNVTTTSNVTTSTRGCREKCSIQFCSERARICSARG